MVYSYKYLKHHLWHNTLLGLPFFTYTEVFRTGKGYRSLALAWQYATEVLLVLVSAACVGFLPLALHEIDLMCACLSPVFHSWQIIAKTVHFKIHRRGLLKILQDLECILAENHKVLSHVDFEKIFDQKSRHIRRTHIGHLIGQIITTSTFFLPIGVEFCFNFSERTPLPIVSYIPWDTKTTHGYGFAFVLLASGFYLYNTKMVALDYFIMDIIALHYSEIMFLNEAMIKILSRLDEGSLSSKRGVIILGDWVKLHQRTMRSRRCLKSQLSGYLIIEYLYVFVHTCLPAFVITSTLSWNWFQKIALVGMVSSALLAFYLLAEAGDTLNAVSDEIRHTLYGQWVIKSSQIRRIYMMYTALDKKPFYLMFSSLFPLCFPTLIAIFRLILTYYMTLNELQTRKSKVTN